MKNNSEKWFDVPTTDAYHTYSAERYVAPTDLVDNAVPGTVQTPSAQTWLATSEQMLYYSDPNHHTVASRE